MASSRDVARIVIHCSRFEKTERSCAAGGGERRRAMVQRVSRHRAGQDVFTDPLFVATAFAAVLLVGLAKGGFSGIGMAATPLLALAVPPLQALAILLPILMVQ